MGYHMAALLTERRTATGSEMSFLSTSLDVATLVLLGTLCLPFVAGQRLALSSNFLKLSFFLIFFIKLSYLFIYFLSNGR